MRSSTNFLLAMVTEANSLYSIVAGQLSQVKKAPNEA
jgi:hypothetical protein